VYNRAKEAICGIRSTFKRLTKDTRSGFRETYLSTVEELSRDKESRYVDVGRNA
jgi:hypothetical protein